MGAKPDAGGQDGYQGEERRRRRVKAEWTGPERRTRFAQSAKRQLLELGDTPEDLNEPLQERPPGGGTASDEGSEDRRSDNRRKN